MINPTTLTLEAARLRLRANQPGLRERDRNRLLDQADTRMQAVNAFYADMGDGPKPYTFAEIIRQRLTPLQAVTLCLAVVAIGIAGGFALCLIP
jgi:hypothetical protein